MNRSKNPLRTLINQILKSKIKSKSQAYLKLNKFFQSNKTEFLFTIKNILYEILDIFHLNLNVRKTLNFIANTISKILSPIEISSKSEITINIFDYIIKLCSSQKEKLRMASFYYLHLQTNTQIEISELTKTKITKLIEDSIIDKCPQVRSTIMDLVHKFQLNNILINTMQKDPNESIRKKCLKLLNKDFLYGHEVYNRLLDRSSEVRYTCLIKLCHVPVKDFPDIALYSVFSLAVYDSNEKIRTKAQGMIFDAIDLLGFKYFFNRVNDKNNVLTKVFKDKLMSNPQKIGQLHEETCKSLMSSDCSEIYLFRISSEAMRSINCSLNVTLDDIIYIGSLFITSEFHIINILKTLKCIDIYNEENKVQIANFIINLLKNLSIPNRDIDINFESNPCVYYGLGNVYENAIIILKQVYELNDDEYNANIKQLVEEALEGSCAADKNFMNKFLEYNKKNDKLMEDIKNIEKNSKNQEIPIIETSVVGAQYDRLLNEQRLVDRKIDNLYRKYIKSLIILVYGLKYSKIKTISHDLVNYLDTLILPLLDNQNSNIHYLTLNSLGYFCFYSIDIAIKNVEVFIRKLNNENPIIKNSALKFLFDIFCTYSYKNVSGLKNAIIPMYETLNLNDSVNFETSVIGFLKLIINDKLPNCYGVLLKLMFLLLNKSTNLHFTEIIMNGLKIYTSSSDKKARKFVRMVKVLIMCVKDNNCQENLHFTREGFYKFINILDNNFYHFSILYCSCYLFINFKLTKKIFNKIISVLNLKALKDNQVKCLEGLFTGFISKCPKAMMKVFDGLKGLNITAADCLEEEKRCCKANSLWLKYIKSKKHKFCVEGLLCDYYENMLLEIDLPNKRQRVRD